MTRRIRSSTRKQPRRLSRAARRAMAAAGSGNLAKWRAQQPDSTASVKKQADEFERSLLDQIGPGASAVQRGLVAAAASTYAGLVLARKRLARRKHADANELLERVGWLAGSLVRTLKALKLDQKSKPRTLAEAFASKVEPNAEIQSLKPPISTLTAEDLA